MRLATWALGLWVGVLCAPEHPTATLVCLFSALGLGAVWVALFVDGPRLLRLVCELSLWIAVGAMIGTPARRVRHAVEVDRSVARYLGRLALAPQWSAEHVTLTIDLDARAAPSEARYRPLEIDERISLQVGTNARDPRGPLGSLRAGDGVAFVAALAPLREFRNPGAPDRSARRREIGIDRSGWIEGAASLVVVERGSSASASSGLERLRSAVRKALVRDLSPQRAAIVRALVLGEGSAVEPATAAAYRASGTAHVLAVSGLHLVLIVGSLRWLLAWLFARIPPLCERWGAPRLAAIAALPATWAYALFAGAQPSVLRAAAMATLAFAGAVFGRRSWAPTGLALAALGIAVVDPSAVKDVGLQLSLAAVAGLLALEPRLRRLLRVHDLRSFAWRTLGRAATTSLAATLATIPILALHFHRISIVSPVANLVAVPLGTFVVLPVCLAGAGAMTLAPASSAWVAPVVGLSVDALNATARFFAALPNAAVPAPPPTPIELVLLLAALLLLAFGRGRGPAWASFACVVAVVVLEALVPIVRRMQTDLHVSFLDVGQGEATLLQLPGGETVLVDAGGVAGTTAGDFDVGARVVVPALERLRVHRIDRLVLSHPHPDHVGGLAAVAERFAVGEFWENGQGEREGGGPPYAALRAVLHADRVVIRRPPDLCGRPARLGAASLQVLWPCMPGGYDAGLSTNDNSLVIRVEAAGRRLLMTGDIEEDAENALVALRPFDLEADVLKVAHHGSRTSSSAAFLRAVGARWALISCGPNNRFGHPHAEALARLRVSGARIERIDVEGAVSLEIADGRVRFAASKR